MLRLIKLKITQPACFQRARFEFLTLIILLFGDSNPFISIELMFRFCIIYCIAVLNDFLKVSFVYTFLSFFGGWGIIIVISCMIC